MTGHPSDSILALFAGGDLTGLRRWLVSTHVAGCGGCRKEVTAYRDASVAMLQSSAKLPLDLDWQRLSAEMRANIHLGLAAGECVAAAPDGRERIGWKAALVMASVTVLVITGWFLNAPRRQDPRLADGGMVLETTRTGIEMKRNGAMFSLRSPAQDGLSVSMSGQGSVGARYLDADTGQVTIHSVYAE